MSRNNLTICHSEACKLLSSAAAWSYSGRHAPLEIWSRDSHLFQRNLLEISPPPWVCCEHQKFNLAILLSLCCWSTCGPLMTNLYPPIGSAWRKAEDNQSNTNWAFQNSVVLFLQRSQYSSYPLCVCMCVKGHYSVHNHSDILLI